MMNNVVINTFRQPVELIPAATSLIGAGVMLSMPGWFYTSPSMSYLLAAVATTHAVIRFKQGLTLVKRRRNLTRLTTYMLQADAIPWSRHMLFLGKGFRWQARHTQMLYELNQQQYEHLLLPGKLYTLARKLELATEHSQWHWISRTTRADSAWNPVRPLPPVEGSPALHGIELVEEDIWSPLSERVGHMVVLGATRVGKTTLCELLVTQDIRRGDIVIVFDPKGSAELLKRMYAEASRAGRLEQFYVFHLGHPALSARYNPLGNFARVTEVATRTANQLPGEGTSATFKQFVWGFVNVIARAMTSLGDRPSYETLYRYAVNIDELALRYFTQLLDKKLPHWRDDPTGPSALSAEKSTTEMARKTGRSAIILATVLYLQQQGVYDTVADSLSAVLTKDRSYFDKLVSSLYPLLEKMTTGQISELLSPDYLNPDDKRPIIDWMNVINSGGIVYVGLDALSDAEVAGAVGNAMFADLTSTAGKIYKHGQSYGQSHDTPRRKLALHADEFSDLIGDEFLPLVNKSGGADFQVTVYTQTWQDVEARLGSAAKAGQIAGNLNSLIMLRVKHPDTAKLLTDQLPEVSVYRAISTSGSTDAALDGLSTDFNEFTSATRDQISAEKIPLLSPADLVRLPKGQAFALIEGGTLYKLRLPMASPVDDTHMPTDLKQIADYMRSQYENHHQASGEDELTEQGAGSGY